MQEHVTTKQILDFYLEAGVDETIGEVPLDRFGMAPPPAIKRPTETVTPQTSPISNLSSVARQPQTSPSSTEVNLPNTEPVQKAKTTAAQATSLSDLKAALENFEGCALQKMATRTVFSSGNSTASLMVIDRAPSAEEDRKGQPFGGTTGDLLEKMLASIGIADYYLASCLPWRPPGGRAPTREEQAICLPFIKKHIELAAPTHILLCGEAAAFVLEQKNGINKLRGKWTDIETGSTTIPALGIFHPAFLMDHPASKKLAWEDLLKLKAALMQQP